jgi:hypothetical protein
VSHTKIEEIFSQHVKMISDLMKKLCMSLTNEHGYNTWLYCFTFTLIINITKISTSIPIRITL